MFSPWSTFESIHLNWYIIARISILVHDFLKKLLRPHAASARATVDVLNACSIICNHGQWTEGVCRHPNQSWAHFGFTQSLERLLPHACCNLLDQKSCTAQQATALDFSLRASCTWRGCNGWCHHEFRRSKLSWRECGAAPDVSPDRVECQGNKLWRHPAWPV